MRADMNDLLSPPLRALALVTTLAVAGCYPREAILTNADRAAIATAVEATWAGMMTGGRALDPDRVRAGYADRPIVAFNGRIIEDFDRDQFDETRQWLRSL
jgi:hypothetical protein